VLVVLVTVVLDAVIVVTVALVAVLVSTQSVNVPS
jgi:hypothetical protein